MGSEMCIRDRSCIVAARAILRRYVAALTNDQSVVAIEHAVDGRIESVEVFWGNRTERIRPRRFAVRVSGLRPSGAGFGRPVKEDDHARHAPTTVYAAMSGSPARPGESPGLDLHVDIRARRANRPLPPRSAGHHLVSASNLAAVPPRMLIRSSSVRPGVSRMWSTAVRVHG